ncbi:MAG TPA: ferritin-like domain-containing protein [Solirubrobacterales bacterium]|nr:ferritin-like domain-containing protein [Solirubrobacterales bacterium]
MGSEQSIVSSGWRRGFGRAAVFLLGVTALLAGCGKSGQGAKTDSEKAADVEVLNTLLAEELTVVDAYERANPLLRGQMLAAGRQFRGQTQAHLDALTKAVRGLGGETDAEAVELEAPAPQSHVEALAFLYEAENAAIAQALEAVPQLEFTAPRMLSAALVGNHSQHLTVLRQGLGANSAASVPQPFESGEEPPPGGEAG